MIEFMRDLRKKLDDEIAHNVIYIGDGGPCDWAEYQRCTGVIRGLRRAMDMIDEVYRRHFEEGEDT